MISEAMGKILGMVMAYGVSSLGLLLAYVNYRKRIVRAERVMSGTAWAVIATVFLVLGAGAWVVSTLATPPGAAPVAADLEVPEEVQAPELPAPVEAPAPREDRPAFTWVGLLVPGVIFLFATWVTAALHRHFSTGDHAAHATPRPEGQSTSD